MTATDEMIARFMAVFGEPRTTDPDLFFAEYHKALGHFSPEVLAKATDRVMLTATFWPRPSEVFNEAHAVVAMMPRTSRVDWDAVEAERRQGWSFSDVTKAARKFDSDEHNAMMQQWRGFMAGFGAPVRFDENGKWIKPHLTERSRDMSSDRDPTGELNTNEPDRFGRCHRGHQTQAADSA